MKITIDLPDFDLKQVKDVYRKHYRLSPKMLVNKDDVKEFLSALISADLDAINYPGESNSSQ